MSFDPQQAVRALALPPGRLTTETLIAHAAARLGRVIHLTVLPGLGQLGMCGMWIPADTGTDYLFIDAAAAASPVQKLHTVGHEIGHIVAGHPPALTPEGFLVEMLATCYPHLPRSLLLHGLLARSDLNSPQEREAEEFATALMVRIARQADQPASHIGRAALGAFGHPVQRTLDV